MNADCLMCELEQILDDQAEEFRQELQKMNPVRDPNYDPLFDGLLYADQSLGDAEG